VLVLDPSGRVLLVRFRSAARRGWWATPGGGLEAGEHHRAAARRELAEELGRDDIEIGLQIGVRRHTMYFEDRWLTQHERWFLARHEAFDAPRERLAALATEGVDDICWWSAAELAAARELTAPRRLAILIDEIVADRLPAPETDLGF
jgi:8-oxo-dGTP pyrophosphatase MutT (NUDIX family)